MNNYLLDNFDKLKNDETYIKRLFTSYKNIYSYCENKNLINNEYDNENYIHHYSKEILKEWLKKLYPLNRSEIEYPITKKSIKKNIVKELGFNPTMSDCYLLLNQHLVSRCDLVLFEGDIPIKYFEIYNTNKISDKKLKNLKDLGIKNVYEIDAKYIINCKKNRIPEDLEKHLIQKL